MAEPDLAAAFQKPKVMQAIMESQQNPMAIMKYQDDPDVMMARPFSPTSPPKGQQSSSHAARSRSGQNYRHGPSP
jgi:hypothetical protein